MKNDDLRVKKTREAIRQAFQELVCTVEYHEITIKKLSEVAKINRKTFYLHYSTLDELILEFQNEVINYILSKKIRCGNLDDIKSMIAAFFDFVSDLPKFHERMICHQSYQFIGEQINLAFIEELKTRERGHLCKDIEKEDIIFTYLGTNAFTLYRHWVNDGKKISLEKLKNFTIQLMIDGLKNIL